MIQFEQRAQVAVQSPNRADVALFVGAVARRAGTRVDPLTPRARTADPLYRWLEAGGWTQEQNRRDRAPLDALLDVPVPIESFAEFDRLFAWEDRLLVDSRRGATYLGLSVRAFFEEGGRRCYVVRVCDPWLHGMGAGAENLLIPNVAGRPTGSGVDRGSWLGIWHLYGLPEVSLVCIPDLPDACMAPPPPPHPLPAPLPLPERFVECAPPLPGDSVPGFARAFSAPRCDHDCYRRWARAVRIAVEGIERAEPTTTLRQAQLLAAIPLPLLPALPEADRDLLGYLKREQGLDLEVPTGLASSFLQLVFPWVRMVGSEQLPEGLASPDGALAGVLARNALTRGTFHSAAGSSLISVHDLEPIVSRKDKIGRAQLTRQSSEGLVTAELDDAEQLALTPLARGALPSQTAETLVRRVTVLDQTPDGVRLLSDVTTTPDFSYRQAHVRRLVSALARSARVIGETNVFENSGPALWSSIADQITRVLRATWRAGALRGAREAEAFGVRCDHSTMSQNDIDNGRVIVEVELAPAPAIERIVISFALQDGSVSTRAA